MFDDKFFEAAGLGHYTPEQKKDLSEKLGDLAQARIAKRLSEVLSDEQADHFAQLVDANQEDEAFTYLESVYPDYPVLVQEELAGVMNDFQADMTEIARAIDEPSQQ